MSMASYGNSGASLRLGVLLALLLQCALAAAGGMITCESLSRSTCAFAFAVSSAGARCVLEKEMGAGEDGGEERHVCRTSSIRADAGLSGWIETDGCVEACGLERVTLGISSDSLLESRFTEKLCSPQCYQGCPNVVDLYFNLAAGEGKPPCPATFLCRRCGRPFRVRTRFFDAPPDWVIKMPLLPPLSSFGGCSHT